jgi:hypothetical protein
MPRRRSQSRAILLGAIAVAAGFALLFGLAWAAGRGDIDPSNLSDREQWVGNADRLARRVRTDGPFILPDLSPNRDRVVLLQHLGERDDRNWFAIDGGTADCPVEWTGDGFEDCDGEYPIDGEGLTRYETKVVDNGVYVDLRTRV